MLRLVVLLLATSTLVSATVCDVCDLRVSAARVGPDLGWRTGVDGVAGVDLTVLGVMGGVGLAHDRRDVATGQRQATIARLIAGPYLPLGPTNIECLPWLGRGRAALTTPLGNSPAHPVTEYGIDGLITLVLGSWVVGGGGGWQRASDLEHDSWQTGILVGVRL